MLSILRLFLINDINYLISSLLCQVLQDSLLKQMIRCFKIVIDNIYDINEIFFDKNVKKCNMNFALFTIDVINIFDLSLF